jgi:1,2-phenylacetyl-CoA epoxidase catalytic subunit
MTTPKSAALLAAALLLTAGRALAGDVSVTAKTEPPPLETNPLSFWGGKAVFDFEERFRWEIRDNNFDFNDAVNAPTDDNWFLQRARLGLKLSPTPWLRMYGQIQDSREINSDRPDFPGKLGAEGDDAVDLRQAWIELGNPKVFPLTLKLGRQILSYGDERVIGAFDWNNIGRTFDAVKLRWESKDAWVEAFASSVVVPERGSYNQSDFFNGNELDRQQIFSGIYAECNALWFQSTDLYVLHLHENDSVKYQDNDRGDTNFFTIGTRWKSKPGAFAKSEDVMSKDKDNKAVALPGPKPAVGLDYTFEGAFQTGDVRGQDLTAFAAHGDVGYTLDMPWRPRFAVGYSFATGDDEPGDREIQTFQNLFPTNHKFYGQMDLFSWQNIHDLEFDFKISPVRNVTLRADYHAFWLESTEDAWYRANGATTVRPINATSRAAGNYVGSEIDFLATWNVTKWFQVEGGYSHFFSGDYLKDTGPHDDADFGYVQAKLTF